MIFAIVACVLFIVVTVLNVWAVISYSIHEIRHAVRQKVARA